ncbi:MAG: hypothetical protein KGD60_15660, partial [Candidatus Thorarchaeota archaeon]|nr:hypothetical protein [Candidatus Thorarchaeota archaeon]
VCWGWTGNLTFIYWDITKDEGIPGANVTCHLWSSIPQSPEFFDLGNGTYLVEVNTTYLWALPIRCYLIVSFDKTGFEDQEVGTSIMVFPVPTELVVFSPEVNQINENPYHLMVPIGDMIDLQFSYNDTEDSDGYVGGLEGAQTNARIVGPTLVEQYIALTDLGGGYYNLTFDTTEDWLYESVGGIPTSHNLPYLIYVEFTLENRM